jgi:hypothetical protein
MARDACDVGGFRCGLEGGDLRHCEKPEWLPLLEAVGERLTEGFMWMFWVELEDGSRLHAYKHYFTRAYLFLTEDGRAFLPAGATPRSVSTGRSSTPYATGGSSAAGRRRTSKRSTKRS